MKLSDFELDVMEIIWQHESISAVDIHKAIQQQRAVSYSAVKTVIDRLEQKAVLKRVEQQGRTIFYASAIAKEQVSKPMLKGFLKRLFSGKPQQLIAQLIQDEELSDKEIKALEQMLASKKQQDKK
mgnify:CR=1 FL=1